MTRHSASSLYQPTCRFAASSLLNLPYRHISCQPTNVIGVQTKTDIDQLRLRSALYSTNLKSYSFYSIKVTRQALGQESPIPIHLCAVSFKGLASATPPSGSGSNQRARFVLISYAFHTCQVDCYATAALQTTTRWLATLYAATPTLLRFKVVW